MHPDPVHRAPALGEPVHGGHPLGVWEVAMGVSDQRAGVTILTFNGDYKEFNGLLVNNLFFYEPVRVPDDVLVIGIVEDVAGSHGPGVLEE